ncbi:hypothetical protein FGO68_gene5897 [Halteria grandinella]|uniref:Uncharacterized protein n=1 Tax=Halteria grandinella TaxID=5974 RepID=A0A8J8SZZ8_HALGN|nr:hypothetical protein FGO68_gene5897 [Halteria grandinella]
MHRVVKEETKQYCEAPSLWKETCKSSRRFPRRNHSLDSTVRVSSKLYEDDTVRQFSQESGEGFNLQKLKRHQRGRSIIKRGDCECCIAFKKSAKSLASSRQENYPRANLTPLEEKQPLCRLSDSDDDAISQGVKFNLDFLSGNEEGKVSVEFPRFGDRKVNKRNNCTPEDYRSASSSFISERISHNSSPKESSGKEPLYFTQGIESMDQPQDTYFPQEHYVFEPVSKAEGKSALFKLLNHSHVRLLFVVTLYVLVIGNLLNYYGCLTIYTQPPTPIDFSLNPLDDYDPFEDYLDIYLDDDPLDF